MEGVHVGNGKKKEPHKTEDEFTVENNNIVQEAVKSWTTGL